jgi:hypothetical protein
MENLSENSVHNDIVGAGLSLPGNPVLKAMLASSGIDGAQRWMLTFVWRKVQGMAGLAVAARVLASVTRVSSDESSPPPRSDARFHQSG